MEPRGRLDAALLDQDGQFLVLLDERVNDSFELADLPGLLGDFRSQVATLLGQFCINFAALFRHLGASFFILADNRGVQVRRSLVQAAEGFFVLGKRRVGG